MAKKKSKKKKSGFFGKLLKLVLLVAIVGIAYYLFTGNYKATDEAMSYINVAADSNVSVTKDAQTGYYVFENKTATTAGLVFYPGGKVAYEAYAPVLYKLADKYGIKCVLVKMPLNLAVFNTNAAEKAKGLLGGIDHCYIAGHSLGGAMASSYVSKNPGQFERLILLGAYSTADLKQADVKVLLMYGSLDGVMNRAKYVTSKENLPEGYKEQTIQGGNHAYFGGYGEQKDDGTATITPDAQWEKTANNICSWIIADSVSDFFSSFK